VGLLDVKNFSKLNSRQKVGNDLRWCALLRLSHGNHWRSLGDSKGRSENLDEIVITGTACHAMDTTCGYHLQPREVRQTRPAQRSRFAAATAYPSAKETGYPTCSSCSLSRSFQFKLYDLLSPALVAVPIRLVQCGQGRTCFREAKRRVVRASLCPVLGWHREMSAFAASDIRLRSASAA
jgi:hypothetical protein